MAKTENPTPQAQSKAASSAGRGISYPAVSLDEAVRRAKQFWEHERKNAAPLDAAANHWGYSPSSSGVRTLVAALLSYGLMVDRGSGDSRQVQLSERALDIILDTPDRQRALIEAVKNPKIYADLLSEWSPEHLPSDQTIRAHLLRHKNFNPKAVDGFIKDFRSSISFSGLDSGATIPEAKTETNNIERQDEGKAAVVETTGSASGSAGAAGISAPPIHPGVKQDVYVFVDGGQAILQWPEKMSRESFEEFKDWIALELRKIGRVSAAASETKDEK